MIKKEYKLESLKNMIAFRNYLLSDLTSVRISTIETRKININVPEFKFINRLKYVPINGSSNSLDLARSYDISFKGEGEFTGKNLNEVLPNGLSTYDDLLLLEEVNELSFSFTLEKNSAKKDDRFKIVDEYVYDEKSLTLSVVFYDLCEENITRIKEYCNNFNIVEVNKKNIA
jgi:hypothetical protein